MPISTDRTIQFVTLGPIVPPKRYRKGKNLYGKDLSFNGEDTQHSTHALHPYVAAINPPLARELLHTYVPKDGIVLDPFCGGGGVIVEAMLSGHSALGFDVNPLAILVTKAKTTFIPRDAIIDTGNKIVELAKRISTDLSNGELDEQLAFWFNKECLMRLFTLNDAIDGIENPDLQVLFKVILSGTARDVMLTHRGEVRLRKLTGEDLENFKPDVLKSFTNRVALAATRVPSLQKMPAAGVTWSDVRSTPYADDSVTAIICSPPYADDKNGVGYFQFSRNMLRLIGFSMNEIKKAKSHFLGSVQRKDTPVPPSLSLCISLEHVAKRNTTHYQEAISFYNDYFLAVREMIRVAKQRVVIVIGNRVLSRTLFDNAHITLDLMKASGVNLEHYYTRSFSKKRIPNLGTDGGGINNEHILVFRK